MIYKLAFALLLFSNFAHGQTPSSTSKPFLFIDSVFKKDNQIVEILDFEFSMDIQEIALRLQKSIQEKKEWFEEYFSKNYKAGEGMPYHENFGVTREEYQRIKNTENAPPNLIVKDSGMIKTVRTSNFLTFKSIKNNVRFLENLQIDLKNELLIFLNDTIPFYEEVNAPASTPFGQWHGYSWKEEFSNLSESEELKTDKLISKIVEINIGKVKSNDKYLLCLKYKEVDEGEIITNVDIICYLH